jgi:hypothetical protein
MSDNATARIAELEAEVIRLTTEANTPQPAPPMPFGMTFPPMPSEERAAMRARIAELEAERDRLRAVELADPSEITAAVLAEREALVKIVRDYGAMDPNGNGGALAEQIVAAIRAHAALANPSGE